jgi:hypothetical protein
MITTSGPFGKSDGIRVMAVLGLIKDTDAWNTQHNAGDSGRYAQSTVSDGIVHSTKGCCGTSDSLHYIKQK